MGVEIWRYAGAASQRTSMSGAWIPGSGDMFRCALSKSNSDWNLDMLYLEPLWDAMAVSQLEGKDQEQNSGYSEVIGCAGGASGWT